MLYFSLVMFESLLTYFLLLITQYSDVQDPESPAQVSAGAYALVHAIVIDGTGNEPLYDQTVLIENRQIKAIGGFKYSWI